MGKLRLVGWLSTFALLATACGGGSGDGPSVAPPPPPPPPPAVPDIGLTEVFPQVSLSQPLVMLQAPGDPSRWFVAERAGVIRVFDNDPAANATAVFLDISSQVSTVGEGGLLGMAFHPSFPATPEVYVSYTAPDSQLISVVSRFRSDDGGASLDPASEEPLMLVPQPDINHNGGNIAFGPDGYLYIGFGDGGGAGDPGENAQNLSNVLGAMLRIDVDGLAPYQIPPDNPFPTPDLCAQGFGGTEPCPEIYAYGLRNPWRFSFDSATGDLWLGDVGQNAWEEVDVITAGGDYGWDDREGAHCFEPPADCDTDSIDPVTEYGRALGNSITGGYVYRGAAIPDLQGWYVFGDFGSGIVFGIVADSSSFVEPEVFLDTDLSIVTFAQDLDGELYLADIGSGRIFQVVPGP
ncbi:MAG TPA: PQQ-dependent sugar dehydrogenase [Woeseiaceae bacterium]|nr:PQQ-dependent sugar dehydrogenase [Woeseiaceae bacterium]